MLKEVAIKKKKNARTLHKKTLFTFVVRADLRFRFLQTHGLRTSRLSDIGNYLLPSSSSSFRQ